jgi:hypothetical protein
MDDTDITLLLDKGQDLLQNQDSVSVRKALDNFIQANKIAKDWNPIKPKILYLLATGNFIAGNIEQAYKIIHKAKVTLDIVMKDSMISMPNLRQLLGGTDIDEFIEQLNEIFPEVVELIDLHDENFNENELSMTNFK